MLGRTMMPARRDVAGDHRADRFELLPAHIALVGAGLQRKPVGARLAADLHTDALGRVPCRHGRSTIDIGAAVDRVLDHSVESGVTRTPPGRITVRLLLWQVEVMLMEPEQRLSRASKFLDPVEDQRDRGLHASIRILLEAVACLHKADRGRHDEFAATGLLVASGKRALAQKIKLVLVETSLEPQQQSVVAVPGRVDRLLIDKNCIDDATHLDQLLPIPAVAGEARDFPSADRADLAEADLGHHPFETGALHAAGRRAAEIVVDHFDLGETQRRQPIPHGVLQRPALAVVQHLVRRGLAHVEDRLALQMMSADLVSDHGRPPPLLAPLSPAHARGSGVSSARAAPPVRPSAGRANPARRARPGLRTYPSAVTRGAVCANPDR